jgi:5-methyltetrahydrofolate--homocysteine methyltransferase
MGIEELLAALSKSVIEGHHSDAEQTTQSLLQVNVTPEVILERGLLPGMEIVGQRFKAGQIFLPQVLVAARAMKMSMKLLTPLLAAAKIVSKGTILIGTVKGDVHDIGKNLVSIMLQGSGFRVVDIGIDCPSGKFVAGVREHNPDVIALSAMLTTTMVYMKVVIDDLRLNNVAVPIIVGGAPINRAYAESIGATAYARTASDAVDVVRRLMSQAAA